VFSGDLVYTVSVLGLLDRDFLGRMALGTAVLTHHAAHQPL
jgi:hypothetical protein